MSHHKGPICYRNWKAALEGYPSSIAYEHPLFTDSDITGEIMEGYGPYQFLNTVPIYRSNVAPSIVLRVSNHIPIKDVKKVEMNKTDASHYHGGELCDEIAALLSLNLGIRFKAGDLTREFNINGDPKGHPRHYFWGGNPILNYSSRGLMLPYSKGAKCINDARLLGKLPYLKSNDAITLIMAARLYQDALWISESEPALAWLLFVSSIETAAGHWRKKKDSPVERLKAFNIELVRSLEQFGSESLIEMVANAFSNIVGSTKKFVDFLIQHLPPPREIRPPLFVQHPWEIDVFRDSFKTIYTWRSKALHGGVSFPLPMCEPPMKFKNHLFAEKPFGLAIGAKGAVWVAKDTPMLLHLFEYIARNSLIRWWESLISK
jgi:hypothetical protein